MPTPQICNRNECGFTDITLNVKAEGNNFFCEGEEAIVEIDETTSFDFDFFVYYWCDGVVDTLTLQDQPAKHRYVINPEDRCNNSQDDYFVQIIGVKECGEEVTCRTVGVSLAIIYKPVADFIAPEEACVNTEIAFSDVSCNADEGNYLWDFGDGTTSTETNPTHTYESTGNYTVRLTVTNNCGDNMLARNIQVVDNSDIICQPCRARDSLTLVDFYNATDGANWINTWDLSLPIETWFGITLNADGCINGIINNENNLSGSLPNSIGDLNELEILEISNNNISGNIPSELGSLSKLTELNLNANSLSGTIPNEIGGLTNLKNLDISNNQLEGGLPNTISNLSNLEILRISNNIIIGNIPTEIGFLINLTDLNINNNSFSGSIPNEVSNLTNLRNLDFSSNTLEDNLPNWISNLNNLEILRISNNKIIGNIPTEIGNLINLNNLNFANNQLEGEIPNSISNLVNLEEIKMHGNNLSGCFPEFTSNICPINYDFNNNPQLPWQGNFSRICNGEESINASCDDGNFDTKDDSIQEDCSCLGTMCRTKDSLALVEVYNATNGDNWTISWDLNTPINTWFGVTLTEEGCVGELELCQNCSDGADAIGNNLQGTLPSDLGKLSNLTTLSILKNEGLTGNIPSELVELTNLRILNLSFNQLTGIIPTGINNLTRLQELRLNNNQLSGGIPAEITQLTELQVLHLNNNPLTGEIPQNIGQLTKLTSLNLSNSNLSGTIPPDIGDLCDLEELFISNNQLNDCLPPELSQLESLQKLEASNNNFSCATLPNELIVLCQLPTLDLSNNETLPNFDSFCIDGTNATSCINIENNLMEFDTLQNIIAPLTCGEYTLDSIFVCELSMGIAKVHETSTYGYLQQQLIYPDGQQETITTFVGCSGLAIETCSQNNDSTTCVRKVFSSEIWNQLTLEETWNCNEMDSYCFEELENEPKPIIPFNIFPNPSGYRINFYCQSDMDIEELKVMNLWGQPINFNILSSSDIVTIDLLSNPSGIYLVSIPGKEKNYVSKFILLNP